MRDWKSEGLDHAGRQTIADIKIINQLAVLSSLHGLPRNQSIAKQTLNEMQNNKAFVSINRAMFEYDEENKTVFA